jgi:hypothetical protein
VKRSFLGVALGERAVLLATSVDPSFIAQLEEILPIVEATVRGLFDAPFRLYPRVYGQQGSTLWPAAQSEAPREVFLLVECVAATAAAAKGALTVFKQYLLHHGFAGRLSTSGNVAFPLTPPELDAAAAYRFSLYHLMDVDDLAGMFPIETETV